MSCFTESENCKYELNKSTSSLVDVSLSTPIPLESSAMKKTSVVLPQSSETPSLSLEANHQHQRDIGHTSLNSSSIISDGSSFFLNKINDDSKDNDHSIGDSQITLSTPPEPSRKSSSSNEEGHTSTIMMTIGGTDTSSILNQSLMRSVDLDDSECKQQNYSNIPPQSVYDDNQYGSQYQNDDECRIFDEGDEVVLNSTEEMNNQNENNNADDNINNNNDDEEEEEEQQEETDEERIRRENEESERLAWALMQEEQNAAYQAQIDFLNQNVHNFSDEDRAALALVMQESATVIRQNNATITRNSQEGNGEEDEQHNEEHDEQEDEVEEEEEEDDDEEAWTGGEHYERLLELGHVLGDVKTERWRLRADSVISELPTVTYQQIQQEHSTENYESSTKPTDTSITTTTCCAAAVTPSAISSATGSGEKKRKVVRTLDTKCSVCMELYENNDELILLPVCQHYFHVDCAKGWLKDHNSCPICKVKVSSPEK